MSVLLWIAVLVGAWCVASVVAALTLGAYLRRRHQTTDPHGALRPLETGPLRLWLGDFPAIPDDADGLIGAAFAAGLPGPRSAPEAGDAREQSHTAAGR